jgi:hypothetical protein
MYVLIYYLPSTHRGSTNILAQACLSGQDRFLNRMPNDFTFAIYVFLHMFYEKQLFVRRASTFSFIFELCRLILFISLATQTYVLFGVLEGARNRRFPTSNILTHLVVKVRIARSAFCLWKT